jgi:prevent-host-death family protein
MRQVQSSVAKAKFAELLDAVERGETIIITRRGEAIARIEPEAEARRKRVEEAFRRIDAIRKQNLPVTLEELLEWKNEGRM